MDDISRGVIDYSYDDLDRPTNVQQPDGNNISYDYDPNGNRTEITTPAGTVQYAYDALNRVDTVTDYVADPAGATTTLTYTPLGLMDTISRPNGVTTDYGYDARHRLTDIIHGSFATGDPHTFAYSYDLANNATQLIETRNSMTITTDWQYDDAYRLLTETTDRSGVSATTAFAYDAMGNRLSQTTGNETTTYTYNELDQLVSDGYATYEYDVRGNLIELTAEGLTTDYIYDAQNRLTGMDIPVIGSLNYTYDHRGQRIQEDTPEGIVNYLWDDFSSYGNIVYEFDNSGQELAAYTYSGNTLLAQTRNDFTTYYLQDAIGSTHALTDEAGNVVATYDYDAFGELVEDTSTVENDFLFTGQQFDELSGLYNLRARFYNPSLGRFNGRDPFPYNFQNPIELNRYTYALNNPVNYTDPTGQSAIVEYVTPQIDPLESAGAGAFGGFTNGLLMGTVMSIAHATGLCPNPALTAGMDYFRFVLDVAMQGAAYGAVFGGAVGFASTFGSTAAGLVSDGFILYGISDSLKDFISNPNLCTATFLLMDAWDAKSIGDTVNPSTSGPNNETTRPDPIDRTPHIDENGHPVDVDNGGNGGSPEDCNSFSEDTSVSTTEGDIPIAEVVVDDTVFAFDPETGEVGKYTVTDTINHEDNVIAYLTIEGEEIETTPWHLFYTDEGWVEAEDLELGDQILSLDGEYGTVDKLIIVDETQMMYDLTVDEVHTFAVGDGAWIVHNCAKQMDFGKDNNEWDILLNGKTHQLSLFNHIAYGNVDNLGRATGAAAILEKPLGTGSEASTDLPNGWPNGYERGHLLAKSLGGDGSLDTNIAPITPAANKRMYWDAEYLVQQAVDNGQIVQYQVTPNYSGNSITPDSFTVIANGDKGFALNITIQNK